MLVRAVRDAYDELYCYTLEHPSPDFVTQHVVDAWAAQQAEATAKPVTLAFGLVGLYLHLERGYTGREVQLAHMALARRSHTWPTFPLPADRGSVTPVDVLTAPAGPERVAAIDRWCASVWEAYRETRPAVIALLERHGII